MTVKRTLGRLETVSATLAALALAVGVSVLAAWHWDIEWLQTVLRGGAPMRPYAALGVVLLGFSLLLQCKAAAPRLREAAWLQRSRWLIAKLTAAVVMVLGLVTLSQHVFGWDLGIDRWLFEEKLRRFPFANPHRLPPGAALCLALVGAALLGLDVQTAKGRRPAQTLLFGALLVSYLVIIGYLFQGSWLFPAAVNNGMAFHAAVAFVLLSIGALCARPQHSVIALLSGDSPGGVMARRLLPLIVVVPIVLGWLEYLAEEHGLLGNASGTAALATMITVVFALLAWATTGRLDRAEAERKRAEEALRAAKEQLARHAQNLEVAVAERTQELQQTIRDLETFSYSMSHDLRAPLRAVQGFTEMIGMDFGEALGNGGRDYLGRITAAIRRMDRMIHDVLICTKLSRQNEVKLHTLDVEAFIRQLVAERPAWQPPQSEIRIESPLLPVRAAESFLGQCVTNLVENALKFIAPGQTPHLRIRSEAHGDSVRLWFEDHGIGIPKESHGQLFKMFSRLHPQANYEGTGIGLYIVRVAAGRMGGRVGAESEAAGGSRFWLELPRGETT